MQAQQLYFEAPCECVEFCLNSFRNNGPNSSRRPTGPPGQYPLYSRTVLRAVAENTAAGHIARINEHREYLCQHWGEPLAKKWKKKNPNQKIAILKKADPNLFSRPWFPLQEHTFAIKLQTIDQAEAHRNSYLLGYLDVESLSKDYLKLLALIQNRALFSPAEWALHDNLQLQFPWVECKVKTEFSPLCMDVSAAEYGSLKPWSAGGAHGGELLGYPRAKLLLEAQENIYRFLRNVTAQIVGTSTPVTTSGTVQIDPFRIDFVDQKTEELRSSYLNMPFCPPPKFDIDLMVSKAEAQFNMSNDHLCALQIDSDYLRREIRLYRDGLPPNHPADGVYNEIALMVPLGVWNYFSWYYIIRACQHVKFLQSQFADSILLGQPLPEAYERVLQELEYTLDSHIIDRYDVLQLALSSRPRFKDYYLSTVNDNGTRDIALLMPFDGALKKEPLFYILETIASSNVANRGLCDVATRLAFLHDYLAGASRKEASFLDEDLYGMYNGFAAAYELRLLFELQMPRPKRNLGAQQPRVSCSEKNMAATSSLHVLSYQYNKVIDKRLRFIPHPEGAIALEKFVKAYSEFKEEGSNVNLKLYLFDTVCHARKDYWKAYAKKYTELVNEFIPQYGMARDQEGTNEIKSYEELLTQFYQPWGRDFEHAERQKILDRIDARKAPVQASLATLSLSDREPPQDTWGSSDPQGDTAPTKGKEKVKTRPDEPAPSREVEEEPVPDVLPPRGPRQILITRETKELLELMFSIDQGHKAPVEWRLFVRAMVDIGFSARQTSGSEVEFRPINPDLRWAGRIIFHRPHPEPKIDQVLLRLMGRRLIRNFEGWADAVWTLRPRNAR